MPRQEGLPVLRPQQGMASQSRVPGLRPECCSLEGEAGKGWMQKVKTRVWECTGPGATVCCRVCHWLIHPTMSAQLSACRGEKRLCRQIFRDEGVADNPSRPAFPRNGAVTIRGGEELQCTT